MKTTKRIIFLSICSLIAVQIFFSSAYAGTTYDHAIGLTYLNGFSDVGDFHEDMGYDVEMMSNIGASYRFITNLDNCMRFDAGIGPVSMMFGDAEYWDIPLSFTAGYSFLSEEKFRPYIRGGFSYHFNDGDYVDTSAGFGLIGAVGFEIGKRGRTSFFIETAYDTAEATFKGTSYQNGKEKQEDIKINGLMISIGVVF